MDGTSLALVTTSPSGTSSPLATSTVLAITLSIASAEASTPDPVYGMPRVSSRPWSLPSSPHGPCSAMNAMSIRPPPPVGMSAAVAGTSADDARCMRSRIAAGSS